MDGSQQIFRNVISDLDRLQHQDLAKHLYSTALLRRNKKAPQVSWSQWPMEEPPIPRELSGDHDRDHDHAADPGSSTTAREYLVSAFSAFLRKTVYERIHSDGLEPVLEPEPEAGILGDYLVDRLEDMLELLPPGAAPKRPMSHEALNVSGPSKCRLQRLFEFEENSGD